jgi:hypothetical protein
MRTRMHLTRRRKMNLSLLRPSGRWRRGCWCGRCAQKRMRKSIDARLKSSMRTSWRWDFRRARCTRQSASCGTGGPPLAFCWVCLRQQRVKPCRHLLIIDVSIEKYPGFASFWFNLNICDTACFCMQHFSQLNSLVHYWWVGAREEDVAVDATDQGYIAWSWNRTEWAEAMWARITHKVVDDDDYVVRVILIFTTRKRAIGGKLPATHLKCGALRVYTRSAHAIMRHT